MVTTGSFLKTRLNGHLAPPSVEAELDADIARFQELQKTDAQISIDQASLMMFACAIAEWQKYDYSSLDSPNSVSKLTDEQIGAPVLYCVRAIEVLTANGTPTVRTLPGCVQNAMWIASSKHQQLRQAMSSTMNAP